MAIYTFSVRELKHPEEAEILKTLKEYCDKTGENFSSIITKAVVNYEQVQSIVRTVNRD